MVIYARPDPEILTTTKCPGEGFLAKEFTKEVYAIIIIITISSAPGKLIVCFIEIPAAYHTA